MIGFGKHTFILPVGALLCHFAMQHGLPTFWYEFDETKTKTESRCFQVIGTGHQIDGKAVFCGTAIDGDYAWHLYEIYEILP